MVHELPERDDDLAIAEASLEQVQTRTPRTPFERDMLRHNERQLRAWIDERSA